MAKKRQAGRTYPPDSVHLRKEGNAAPLPVDFEQRARAFTMPDGSWVGRLFRKRGWTSKEGKS